MTPIKFTDRDQFNAYLDQHITDATVIKTYQISIKFLLKKEEGITLRQSPIITCCYNSELTKEIKNITTFKREYQTALKAVDAFRQANLKDIESSEETTFIIYEKDGQAHRIELNIAG